MGELVWRKNQEAELVRRSQTDALAFSGLYEHYFPMVYKYVYYRLGERDLTEDIVSSIFLKAVERIDSYQAQRGEFGPWLFRIAHNVVVDHYRKQARTPVVPLGEQSADPDRTRLTEEQVLGRLTDAALLAHVMRLADRERNIIGLKFGAGFSNGQIATLLELTDNHVAVILYRAMKKLQRMLTEDRA